MSSEPISAEESNRLLAEHNKSLQEKLSELEVYKAAYNQEFDLASEEGRDLARKAQDTLRKTGSQKAVETLLYLCEHGEKDETRLKAAQFIYDKCVTNLLAGEQEGLEKLLEDLRAK